ncbi:spore germination protein [Bacillus sonorensis]|uniref:spore germination protein n=1 Tax=Bacillus sonorensis TaxID=119858 RepID=UPI0028530593|nr:spore germination protein [Bacillus sonorensis]MDR4956000.1 spore germination protein [Bacillus sonorensis]
MKHCCSIYIHQVSDGGVVNFGGAYRINPIMTSKTVEGSGGSNTGITFADTGITDTNVMDDDVSRKALKIDGSLSKTGSHQPA